MKKKFMTKEESSTVQNREFLCRDLYDFEILQSLKAKLGCSLVTVYRSIAKAKIPVYFVPHRRSQVLIHSWDLWRLAITPAWKKYMKRRGYKLYGKRELNRLKQAYNNRDLFELYNCGHFSPLSLSEVVSAADMGLIPITKDYDLPVMFIASVKGLLNLGLPRKT